MFTRLLFRVSVALFHLVLYYLFVIFVLLVRIKIIIIIMLVNWLCDTVSYITVGSKIMGGLSIERYSLTGRNITLHSSLRYDTVWLPNDMVACGCSMFYELSDSSYYHGRCGDG